MAKAKRGGGVTAKSGRGPGDLDAQIANLEQAVKARGIKAAKAILDGHDSDVVKLAFKFLRRRERKTGSAGLGSRIESMLATMSKGDAAMMRAKLLDAKAAQVGK